MTSSIELRDLASRHAQLAFERRQAAKEYETKAANADEGDYRREDWLRLAGHYKRSEVHHKESSDFYRVMAYRESQREKKFNKKSRG
jgi:hypothetical protein